MTLKIVVTTLENEMLTLMQKLWQAVTMNGTAEAKPAAAGDAQAGQQQSPVKLDIIVVGAGISGLATAISTALSGHNVTVFESAKELLEVGQQRSERAGSGLEPHHFIARLTGGVRREIGRRRPASDT